LSPDMNATVSDVVPARTLVAVNSATVRDIQFRLRMTTFYCEMPPTEFPSE